MPLHKLLPGEALQASSNPIVIDLKNDHWTNKAAQSSFLQDATRGVFFQGSNFVFSQQYLDISKEDSPKKKSLEENNINPTEYALEAFLKDKHIVDNHIALKDISEAWNQLLLSIHKNIIFSTFNPQESASNFSPDVSSVCNLYQNAKGECVLDVMTYNFRLLDTRANAKEFLQQKCVIPGLMTAHYVFDPENKSFQLQHMETSNTL